MGKNISSARTLPQSAQIFCIYNSRCVPGLTKNCTRNLLIFQNFTRALARVKFEKLANFKCNFECTSQTRGELYANSITQLQNVQDSLPPKNKKVPKHTTLLCGTDLIIKTARVKFNPFNPLFSS